MHQPSRLISENAKRFLAGEERAKMQAMDKMHYMVFAHIVGGDEYPLKWSAEKKIANLCSVSTGQVSIATRALIESGWKPSALTMPTTRKLNADDVNTWGSEIKPPL
jgi:hypothetical protein